MNQNQSPRYQEDKQAISNNIFEDIKEAILSGQYSPGEKLPTESQLCERYGVSRVTIRAALDRPGAAVDYCTAAGEVAVTYAIPPTRPPVLFGHCCL